MRLRFRVATKVVAHSDFNLSLQQLTRLCRLFAIALQAISSSRLEAVIENSETNNENVIRSRPVDPYEYLSRTFPVMASAIPVLLPYAL